MFIRPSCFYTHRAHASTRCHRRHCGVVAVSVQPRHRHLLGQYDTSPGYTQQRALLSVGNSMLPTRSLGTRVTTQSDSAQHVSLTDRGSPDLVLDAGLPPSLLTTSHSSPSVSLPSVSTTPSLRSSLVDFTTFGLQLARVITTSSYHIATDINKGAERFVDRRITATAEGLSSRTSSLLSDTLQLGHRVPTFVHHGIHSGGTKLTSLSGALTSGVDSALGVMHGLACKGIDWSLEAIQRVDQGLDALTGITDRSPPARRAHGFLQAAQALMDVVVSPLSNASLLDVSTALSTYTKIQAASCISYPPSRGLLLDLSQRENRDFMNELVYRYRQTLAVYTSRVLRFCNVGVKSSSSSDLIQELLGLEPDSILVNRESSSIAHPGYMILLCHSSRSICLIIRGTTEASDILTDLCCQPDSLSGAHEGMESSAASIDHYARPTIHKLCVEYPSYRVIIEGHSLGGGTATVLCLRWLKDSLIAGSDGKRLHAYSFAAPAVVPVGQAHQHYQNITSVIYGLDIVSRASVGAIANINKVLLHLCLKNKQHKHNSNFGMKRSYSEARTPSSADTPSSDHLDSSCFNLPSTGALSDEEEVSHPYSHRLRQSSPCSAPVPRSLDEPTTFPSSFSSLPLLSPTSCHLSNPSEYLDTLSIDVLKHLLAQQHASASSTTRDFWDLQIRLAATALQTLYSTENVLSAAGRCILVMPAEDYIGSQSPHHRTPGGAVLLELDSASLLQLSIDPLLSREAFKSHLPLRLSQALGLKLPSSSDDDNDNTVLLSNHEDDNLLPNSHDLN